MKRILLALVMSVIIVSFCACKTDNNSEITSDSKGEIAVEAVGVWYPHPDVSSETIELREDGTCSVFGNEGEWSVDLKTDNDIVISACSQELVFTSLGNGLITLYENSVGYMVGNALLWDFVGEWIELESGNVFAIDLMALENELYYGRIIGTVIEVYSKDGTEDPMCSLSVEKDGNNDRKLHIAFFENEREKIYLPLDSGSGGGGEDEGSEYEKLLDSLEKILEGGYIYYDETQKIIYGSEAIEYLYNKFASIGAEDILSDFKVLNDVLVGKQDTSITEYPKMSFDYNAFGNPTSQMVYAKFDKLNYIYNEKNEIDKVEFFQRGVYGTPSFDDNGVVSAITVTASNEEKYTVPLIYDNRGNIVKIVFPFALIPSAYDEDITDETVTMEFIYDDENRMIQSSVTYTTEDAEYTQHEFYRTFGFFDKEIVEYFYDSNGVLVRSIEHTTDQNQYGETSWWRSEKEYTYDSDGKIIKTEEISKQIYKKGMANESLEEIKAEAERMNSIAERLFKADGLVKSEKWGYVDQLGEHLHDSNVFWITEFIYGDIYIFSNGE